MRYLPILTSIISFELTKAASNIFRRRPDPEVLFEDPHVQLFCPNDPFEEPLIPTDVIDEAHIFFASNGGAVLKLSDGDYETQIANLGWDPFPYDDEGRTQPEPYPFRTALPRTDSDKCNGLQNPYVLFIPRTTEQAAEAMSIIREYNEEFTTISGGHDYGCQASTHHALILTSRLDTIDVDEDNKFITIGAGVLWATVYDKLNSTDSKFAVMGAQCGNVGVSGYTLGGGFCWHMSRFGGMGAENVECARVVLASSEVVYACRDNEYSDLLWGLMGSGGNNLGLVTEFKFRLISSHDKGYTFRNLEYRFVTDSEIIDREKGFYPEDELKDVAKKWMKVIDKNLKKEKGIGVNYIRFRKPTSTRPYFRFRVILVCAECDWDKDYKSIRDFEKEFPYFSVRNDFYPSMNYYLWQRNHPISFPRGGHSPRDSHFIRSSKMEKFFDISFEYWNPENKGPDYDDDLRGRSLDIYWMDNVIKRPEYMSFNSLAAEDYTWHITIRYNYSEEMWFPINCSSRKWSLELKQKLGDDWRGVYMNYFDPSADKEWYHGDNLKRLLDVKKKYDEDNAFKRLKGIAVNDSDIDCLEAVCQELEAP